MTHKVSKDYILGYQQTALLKAVDEAFLELTACLRALIIRPNIRNRGHMTARKDLIAIIYALR
jgi:hypothetical protein